VLDSQGTYFLNVDLTASGIAVDDVTFCERTVVEFGVAAIPVSAFFAENPVTNVVRLCFAKADARWMRRWGGWRGRGAAFA
jgi:N-succinyldiaminopimelate aminotransferase